MQCCGLRSLPAGAGIPEAGKKAVRLEGLVKPGNRA
jgi:hypothetical protein